MSSYGLKYWFAGAMLGLFAAPAFATITIGAGSSLQFADSTGATNPGHRCTAPSSLIFTTRIART